MSTDTPRCKGYREPGSKTYHVEVFGGDKYRRELATDPPRYIGVGLLEQLSMTDSARGIAVNKAAIERVSKAILAVVHL